MPDPTMLNAFLFLGLFIGTNNAENIAISARGLVTDYPQHAELFRTALRSTLNTLDDLYAPGRVPLLRQAFQLALDTLSKVDPAAQIADLLQPYHPFDFAQVIYHLMHSELDDTEVREFRAMLWKELDTMHQTALKALDHA